MAYEGRPKQKDCALFFSYTTFPVAHQPWEDLPAIERGEALGKRNP